MRLKLLFGLICALLSLLIIPDGAFARIGTSRASSARSEPLSMVCHWGRPCHMERTPDRAQSRRLDHLIAPPAAHQASILGSPIPASSDPPSAAHPLFGIAADGLDSYNVVSSPAKYMAQIGGNVLRVIVNPSNTPSETSQIISFAQKAEFEGDKISLVIQWWDWWNSFGRTLAFYHLALHDYASIHPWAVSIGNEQELGAGHSFTSAQYAAYWKVLAPLVRRAWPRTILVAGEVSPWGYKWLVAALKDGLKGMQAIAGHPYRIRWWFSIKDFVALAHHYHVQPWITEGAILGNHAWPDCAYNKSWAKLDINYYWRKPCEGYSGDVPLGQLHGTAVDLEWEIGSRERGPSRVIPPPGKTT